MKLRSKLLAVSLVTLLLPWSAWKLLQELERFLRDSQETALLSSAHTIATALPSQFTSRLMFAPERVARLRALEGPAAIDGFADEWPDPGQGLEFVSADGVLHARVLAAQVNDLVHLFIDVTDPNTVYAAAGADSSSGDAVRIWLRNARGMQTWTVSPEAPGPVRTRSSDSEGGELEGYWIGTMAITAVAGQQAPETLQEGGYHLELALPVVVQAGSAGVEMAIEIVDVENRGEGPARTIGTARNGRPADWIALEGPWDDLSEWLASAAPTQSRALLVDRGGWLLADSGIEDNPPARTTWLQRLLYRLVSDDRPPIEEPWSEAPVRLLDPAVDSALQGAEASAWAQDLENAIVRNTVAAPVAVNGVIRGAVVLQSRSEGLLLVTNRALGQLLFTTLGLMLGLAAALWYFASRLSRRVQRLSGAVSQAMDRTSDRTMNRDETAGELPLTGDRDELGELARNNARLLKAVDEYTQYLQTLAGKLSHELKTPLAITRSSLDNLGSLDLDDEARRFVERALEGLDRQGEIVRAMSAASRLEQAIEVAEWENVDLAQFVSRCAEGYRAAHPARRIDTRLPEVSPTLKCAPDLLAQALDKLVDNAVTLSGAKSQLTIFVDSGLDEVRLGVRNTGSRLPDALQDRLFDSLVSVRQRRGEVPHLGLGLYIVRLVAEAHGGRVTARNVRIDYAEESAEGVEFVIAVPHAA